MECKIIFYAQGDCKYSNVSCTPGTDVHSSVSCMHKEIVSQLTSIQNLTPQSASGKLQPQPITLGKPNHAPSPKPRAKTFQVIIPWSLGSFNTQLPDDTSGVAKNYETFTTGQSLLYNLRTYTSTQTNFLILAMHQQTPRHGALSNTGLPPQLQNPEM